MPPGCVDWRLQMTGYAGIEPRLNRRRDIYLQNRDGRSTCLLPPSRVSTELGLEEDKDDVGQEDLQRRCGG